MLAAVMAGCSQGDGGRMELRGSVDLDGAPLPTGSITFLPLEGTTSVGGNIENGRFEIPRAKGPTPGKYRVEILAFLPTGETIQDTDSPGRTVAVTRAAIPPKYNENSILTVDLPTQSPDDLVFELDSK